MNRMAADIVFTALNHMYRKSFKAHRTMSKNAKRKYKRGNSVLCTYNMIKLNNSKHTEKENEKCIERAH